MIAAALLALVQPAACDAALVPYAGWREASDQSWDFASPGDRGARLTVIGVQHVRDPAHPQFARLAAAIAGPGRRVVFYEGPDRGVGSDLTDTVTRLGESGAVRFLAREHGLEVRSLEPPPVAQAQALLTRFPAEQVVLYFVLRQAAQLRERDGVSGAALDGAITTLLQRMAPLAQAAGVAEPIADLGALQSATTRYWPDRDWRALPLAWFSPLADDARTGGLFLAAINRAESEARNRHMFAAIMASVQAGERPMVAVGRNHVPMLAPAFTCAFGAGG